MAYQSTIVRCYSDFEGNGWLAYDRAFSCQMTAIKSLDWSELNSTLYKLCFVGKAKRDIVCSTYLKHNHRTSDCTDAPSLALGKISDHGLAFGTKRGASRYVEICRLYNAIGGSKCRFKECKYAHLCSECRRPHPLLACPSLSDEPKCQKTED